MKSFLWFFILALCLSCSEPEKRQLHQVRCKYWLQKCHIKARARCANGHKVSSNRRVDKIGGPQGAYKEFIMKFTCR